MRSAWLILTLVTIPIQLWATPTIRSRSTIKLSVDASEAPRRILHARLVIPVVPGPLTLFYPKWIPAEHAPTGPVVNLAGLELKTAGKPLSWRRDAVDMFAFHCEIPPGANELEVSLDYLLPSETAGFSSSASSTTQLVIIQWNQVLLYPKGYKTDELDYSVHLRLPPRWSYGTALPSAQRTSDGIQFEPVSLTTLVDSPLIAGAHFRSIPLTSGTIPPVQMDIVSDSPAALDVSIETIDKLKRLVDEAGKLFGGAYPFRRYHFLLTLSDHVSHFGEEHSESSDNRLPPRVLFDDDARKVEIGVFPHELAHSWNGKYRRPHNLATPDFQQPMEGDLLWVYEGLTQHLGALLAARSGLWSVEEYRDTVARVAASLDHRAGRTWRPLQDTATAAQVLYYAPEEWDAWRRNVDFYDEGWLIWLEVDAIIRQQSRGQRSLDDFSRLFLGGYSGAPKVKTYAFEDVITALNTVVAHDWRSFFRDRLDSTTNRAPLAGIERSGWRLVYSPVRSDLFKSFEQYTESVDLRYSVGAELEADGTITDIMPNMPFDEAGISPGSKIVAVDGWRWSAERMRAALKSASPARPLQLLIENRERFETYALDYGGGERYPMLERDASKPDLLEQMLEPRSVRQP